MKNKSNLKRNVVCGIILIIVAAVIVLIIYRGGTRRAVSGIDDPIQTDTAGETLMEIDDYHITISYQYNYDIEALVVHTQDYWGFNLDDKLARKDLALAWGAVAEYNEWVDFHWGQGGRWYSFKPDSYSEIEAVGGMAGISQHSANTHVIPANDGIAWKVQCIRRGDHIRLKGYLVNVDAYKSDGTRYYWHSSTTRTDTGDGSCEVMYVTDVTWL